MPIFIIDGENHISIPKSEDATGQGREGFSTKEELANIVNDWPLNRLVEIWNKIPGVKPTERFTNRKTGVNRLWKAAQSLSGDVQNTPAGKVPPSRKKVRRSRKANRQLEGVREGSKKGNVLEMLQRPDGVTLQELMAATGWQAHSVRGFLSGSIANKMALRVISSRRKDGQRVYQVR